MNVLHHGMSNTYYFKMHGRKWTLTLLTPTQVHKTKNGDGNIKGRSLFMSANRVERDLSKSETILAMLMVESRDSEVITPLSPQVQCPLNEFEDVFPQDLPLGLLPKRGIDH